MSRSACLTVRLLPWPPSPARAILTLPYSGLLGSNQAMGDSGVMIAEAAKPVALSEFLLDAGLGQYVGEFYSQGITSVQMLMDSRLCNDDLLRGVGLSESDIQRLRGIPGHRAVRLHPCHAPIQITPLPSHLPVP